jgi:hypothetical protein
MRKSAPGALLAAGFLIFSGLISAAPAHADDEEDDSTSEVVELGDNGKVETHLPRPPKPAGELKRKELEEKYGKQGKLSVPPLVIRPMRDTDDVYEEIEDEDDTDSDSATTSTGSSSSTAVESKVSGAGAKVVGGQTSGTVAGSVGAASARFIAVNPVSASGAGIAGDASTGRQVNPERNTAIDISNVNFTRKTPADAFIQASQVGLYAMAVGAVVLALVAASRAIRRK